MVDKWQKNLKGNDSAILNGDKLWESFRKHSCEHASATNYTKEIENHFLMISIVLKEEVSEVKEGLSEIKDVLKGVKTKSDLMEIIEVTKNYFIDESLKSIPKTKSPSFYCIEILNSVIRDANTQLEENNKILEMNLEKQYAR